MTGAHAYHPLFFRTVRYRGPVQRRESQSAVGTGGRINSAQQRKSKISIVRTEEEDTARNARRGETNRLSISSRRFDDSKRRKGKIAMLANAGLDLSNISLGLSVFCKTKFSQKP
jgi:hypothetical protein